MHGLTLFDIHPLSIAEGKVIDWLRKSIDLVGQTRFAEVPGRYEAEAGAIHFLTSSVASTILVTDIGVRGEADSAA